VFAAQALFLHSSHVSKGDTCMKKILVIEDEQDIREKIITILQYEGYQPISADNGQTGITLAKRDLPDLILCDILMPGISGYGVLDELRNDPLTTAIPFIFLTAIATKEDIRYGMTLGADDYLTKPFEVDDLLATIQTRLEKHETTLKQMEDLRLNLSFVLPHEFRTPLNAITGLTELLLTSDREQLPELDEILEIQQLIYNNALRLQRLIENYLLYASLRLIEYDPEKRRMWQAIEPIETKMAITSAVERKAQKAQRQHDVKVELAEVEARIFEKDLWKIVEELLDNAFKFSEVGTPVRVTSKTEGDQFILSITDQGRGMSREQIARVGAYMQFERKHYEQQGLGLGLVLCRLLAQLHGGEVTIESTPNQGTTVNVMLRRNG
jgi:two-component system sensor histidine kinase/response regulator